MNSTRKLLQQLGLANETYEKFREIPVFQCTICLDEFSLEPDWASTMLSHFKENHLPSFIHMEQEDFYVVEEIDIEEEKNCLPSTNSNLYFCLICNDEFDSATNLSDHMKGHNKTESKGNASSPIIRKRPIESPKNKKTPKLELTFECGFCSHTFISQEAVDNHVTEEHIVEFVADDSQEQEDVEEENVPLLNRRKEFICDTCNTSWKTKGLLVRHMKTHLIVEDRDYKCFKCNKTFKHKRNKDEHELLHLPPQFKCKMCPRVFFRHNDFRKHMEVKHEIQVLDKRSLKKLTGQESDATDQKFSFSCKCCTASFSKLTEMLAHIKSDHSNAKEMIDSENEDYENFIKYDDDIELYACEICNKMFTKLAILNHLRNHKGTKDRKFECTICAKRFRTKHILAEHKILHRVPTYLCEFCNNLFYRMWELNKHVKSEHSMCKKVVGSDESVAGTSFQENYTDYALHDSEPTILYQNEIIEDGGEEIYQCTICDLPTKFNRFHLIKHMNDSHGNVGERKFICNECPKAFKYKGNLDEHKLLHNPAQFPCELCEREFYRHNDLRRHMTKAHNVHIEGKKKVKPNVDDSSDYLVEETIEVDETYDESMQVEEIRYDDDGDEGDEQNEDEENDEVTYATEMLVRAEEVIIKEHDYAENDQMLAMSMSSKNKRLKNDDEDNDDIYRPFECDECDKKFKYKGNLDEHKLHHQPPEFICSVCARGFYRHNDLRRHMLQRHNIQIDAKRPKDPKTSDEMAIEYLDEESLLAQERSFVCDECPKRFKYKGNLDEHKLLHQPAQFNCEACERSFYRHNDLRRHLLQKHNVEIDGKRKTSNEINQPLEIVKLDDKIELFRCTICNIATKFNRSNLIKHIKSHGSSMGDDDEDKKFVCDECPKKFRIKGHLEEHKLLHKPAQFPCDICTKAFFRHNDFRRHMQEKHDVEIESLRSKTIPKTRAKKTK